VKRSCKRMMKFSATWKARAGWNRRNGWPSGNETRLAGRKSANINPVLMEVSGWQNHLLIIFWMFHCHVWDNRRSFLELSQTLNPQIPWNGSTCDKPGVRAGSLESTAKCVLLGGAIEGKAWI
jgi:hypothetical protein